MELFKDTFRWKYGFGLTAHEVKIKFAAESKEEASRWYNKLKTCCEVVLLHFSANYNVGKLLYRTCYSKVNFATSRETPACFSVKSLVKSQLYESAKSLVASHHHPRIEKPRQRDQDAKTS